VRGTVDPEREQIARLAAGDPDEGPILMLNLLRFRARAAAVDGEEGPTGRQAYERYAAGVASHLDAAGGRIVNAGECVEVVIGPEGEWDLVALVEYPSRRAFLTMVGDPDYQATAVWRTAALADSRLILCTAAMAPSA
jgi:uncharacterized protein (DUF1330 family)